MMNTIVTVLPRPVDAQERLLQLALLLVSIRSAATALCRLLVEPLVSKCRLLACLLACLLA